MYNPDSASVSATAVPVKSSSTRKPAAAVPRHVEAAATVISTRERSSGTAATESPMATPNATPNAFGKSSKPKLHRGFAMLSAERRQEIARAGGTAAHACGRAHKYTAEQASAAGRKGGATVSLNREHMSAIGRKGGLARSQRASEKHAPK